MFKIIGGDQKEYGPVSAEDVRRWIAEHRLSAQSLVQAEGTLEWKPIATFPEFAQALADLASSGPPAGQPAPAGPVPLSPAEILARPAALEIGRCLTQSWNLLTANFGLLFAASFLVWFLGLICWMFSLVIPVLGGLVYALLKGVLYGGMCLVFLRRIRAQPASVGDVFGGFSRGFAQLLLAGFLTGLLSQIGLVCCLILPGIYLLIAWTFSVPLVADRSLEFWSAMELSRKVVTRVWFEVLGLIIVAFLPLIAATLLMQIKLFSMIFPVMMDAMSSGQPDIGRMFGAGMKVAAASIPLVGLVKVVALLNLPFGAGALMYAYEDLFGARRAPAP
jgi:uncharacterized protein DUF4339